MKKLILLLIAIISINTLNFAQKYEIKVKINGVKDTVIYLGHHFGAQKYVVDTAKVDSKGNAVFSKNKKLFKGIYLIVLPSRGNTYFEILMPDNQTFSLETDTTDYLNKTKFKGSDENVVFNEYQKKMNDIGKKYSELNKEYVELQKNKEDVSKVREQMQTLSEDREAYMWSIVNNNPKYFFSTIVKSLIDIKIPDAPKNENGEPIDPAFGYHYYKAHYWDHVNFGESGLLRTPIFESKLDYFIQKMIVPAPDSLIVDCHKLIRKAYDEGDTLMFQYTCSHLFNMFDTSKIMGYDAIMVSIAEDWYLNGKAFWADTSLLRKMRDRVEKITPNKIGALSYNLQRMQSNDDKYWTLHDVPANYMVLIFFEPSCGHCKKEVPKLFQEYKDTLKAMGVKIFAVYTQYDKEEWLKFIEEKGLDSSGWYNVWDGPYPHSRFRDYYDIYSTPTIFVLDKEKKIIAKRLGVEHLKDFLKRHEEFNKGK